MAWRLVGVLLIGWGSYVVLDRKCVARNSVTFHRKLWGWVPWAYIRPPSIIRWRVLAPTIGVTMIIVEMALLLVGPTI